MPEAFTVGAGSPSRGDVPDDMVPVRHRVVARRVDLADTVTLALAPVDAPLPEAAPGQFHMLGAFGAGEVPISVSGGPGEAGHVRHTVRAVGAATRALTRLEAGDMVAVRGPFGTGWPLPGQASGDAVVVAGGLGLAPLRPVITALAAARSAGTAGRVVVLVGARAPDQLLYADELADWASRAGWQVRVTVDRAAPGWAGHVGVVTSLLDEVTVAWPGARAFVCGPEVMMRFAARALRDRGVAAEHLHVSLERNMHCAVARCGHCQLGPVFVCREGPVFDWAAAEPLLETRER